MGPRRQRALVGLLSVLVQAVVVAQSRNTATIRGRVLDQTGASVPGASVTIMNTDTGVRRETTTDRGGFYSVASLPLTGAYRITFFLQGFAAKELHGVELRAGETATIDATLVASGGTTQVTVYGTTEGARTDQPQLGVRLDAQKIEETPIPGRKLTSLALLDSAVRPAINTGDLFLNNTLFVVNGSGRRQTTFTLDGSSVDDAWGRQTVFTNVPLSAIQELTVLSNAFSAEYGRTTGAAVNIVTKSGTNALGGDALYMLRPAGLESASPVSTVKTSDVLNQFGASLGGPIVKDRTHYFVAAEFSRQLRDSFITSPLARETVYTGTYNQGLLDARVDHAWKAGRTLAFKANVDGFSDTNPQGTVGGLALPSAGRTFTRKAYGTQAGYNAVIGRSLMNGVRLQVFYGSPITEFEPQQPSLQFVYPGLATQGESRFATLFSHQYELADTLSLSRGRHDVKLGANLMRSTSGGNGREFGSGFVLGQFTVKTGVTAPVSALTMNDIQQFQQSFGTSTYEEQEWIWSLFLQDDVKVRSDLTASIGLRYERQTFTDDVDNFSPRVGLVYDVAGDARTLLRGGYGVYHSEVRTNVAAGWEIGGPTGVVTFSAAPGQFGFPTTLAPLPAFPPGAVLPARDITIRPGRAAYYSRFFDVSKLKGYPAALLNPSTQSVTVGVERELPHKWYVSADYVQQHTTDIDRPLDLNSPSAFVRTAPGQIRSVAAAGATRPIVPMPNGYRRIVTHVNNGEADYDGLHLSVRKRLGQRGSLLASYTLSKTTNTVEPDVPSQDPSDANLLGEAERGPGLLDERHRFVLSGWVRLPSDIGVGGVLTAGSGMHYNITTGTDNNGDGSNADRPVINVGGGVSGVTWVLLGRNAGLGTPFYDASAFVERSFRFGGDRRITARAEVFNLFNHANIVGRNGIYGNAADGTPLPTLGAPLGGISSVLPGRQVQFLLRVRF